VLQNNASELNGISSMLYIELNVSAGGVRRDHYRDIHWQR